MVKPMCFLVILFLIYDGGFAAADGKNCTTDGSLSKECLKADLDRINNTISPCENFFEHVCKHWMVETKMPENMKKTNVFTPMKEQNLKFAYEELKNSKPKFEAIRKAKEFLKQCMDIDTIDNDGLEPLKKKLNEFGGFEVLQGRKKHKTQKWQNVLHNMAEAGVYDDFLFNKAAYANLLDSIKRDIVIDQLTLTLKSPKRYSPESEMYKAYFNLMVDATVMLGADKKVAEKKMKEVLKFETKLAKHTFDGNELYRRVKDMQRFNVSKLKEMIPCIHWKSYFEKVLNYKVNDSTELTTRSKIDYFISVEKALKSTENRVIVNYMLWKFILKSLPLLNNQSRSLYQNFSLEVDGAYENQRWLECMNMYYGTPLSASVGHLYVTKQFTDDSKKELGKITKHITEAIGEYFNGSSWLNDKERSTALLKLKRLKSFYGYPDEILSPDILNKYTRKVKIGGDFYTSFFSLQKAKVAEIVVLLSCSKYCWITRRHSYHVDAFSHWSELYLSYYAGLLNGYFYSPHMTIGAKYGAIGTFIGHEMFHQFDVTGINFDENGNMRKWLSDDSIVIYNANAKCLEDQLSQFNYPTTNITFNANKFQGELLADVVGMQVAYTALDKYLKSHPKAEKDAKYFGYTQRQMYFVAKARTFCEKATDKYWLEDAAFSTHPPMEFRVHGSVMNTKGFAEAFQCPINTQMNPKSKCSFQ